MTVKRIEIYELNLRLHKPYKISFETTYYAENLLIVVSTEDGVVGYGEAAPSRPITGDTREEAFAFLSKAIPYLKNANPSDIPEIHKTLNKVSEDTKLTSQSARTAIDSACYDILGKLENKPVYEILGAPVPRIVPASIGLGIEAPDDLATDTREYMQRFQNNGAWLMKLKLDGNPEMDLKRVLAVSDIFPRGIKLDPNQAYNDPVTAVKVFNSLYDSLGSKIVSIEEPCPKNDLRKMKYVAEHCEIPILADESASTVDDVQRVIANRAADGVNIKLCKIGGIYFAIEAAQLLKDENLQAHVGCMVESRIALSAATSFAAATENIMHVDMDSDIYFETEITTPDSLSFIWGARIPSGRPGLGVDLKAEFGSIINDDVSLRKLIS